MTPVETIRRIPWTMVLAALALMVTGWSGILRGDELAGGEASLLRSVERDPAAGLPDFSRLIDELLDATPALAPAIPGRAD